MRRRRHRRGACDCDGNVLTSVAYAAATASPKVPVTVTATFLTSVAYAAAKASPMVPGLRRQCLDECGDGSDMDRDGACDCDGNVLDECGFAAATASLKVL